MSIYGLMMSINGIVMSIYGIVRKVLSIYGIKLSVWSVLRVDDFFAREDVKLRVITSTGKADVKFVN